MYAIIDVAGQQFKVEKDNKVFVHRLEAGEGENIEFDQVLLIDNDSKVTVGSPVISGALVKAKVLEHLKGDKVIVFKKKRRKGYKKKNGHRQALTQIIIEDILEKGVKAKAKDEKTVKEENTEAKAETTPQAAPKTKPDTEKKETVKKETPLAEKKTAAEKESSAIPKAETKTKAAKKTEEAKPEAEKKEAPEKETKAKAATKAAADTEKKETPAKEDKDTKSEE